MIQYLQNLSFWDWLALATILLILEVFGAGGYLLWIGLAAACVGVLTYLFPALPWVWQFFLFGLLAILTAVVWWRRQRSPLPPSDQPGLNRRGSELLGRRFALHEAIIDGPCRVVYSPDKPLSCGARVWIETDAEVVCVERDVDEETSR